MSISVFLSILVSFVFIGIYAGAETGSYMINRIRLLHRLQQHHHSARILSRVLSDSHIFVFTMLFGQNIAVYILTTTVTALYMGGGISAHDGGRIFGILPWNAEMAATLTLMFPLFLFAEVGPKNLFRKRADLLMYRLAGLLRISVLCFYPFTFMLKRLFNLLTRHIDVEMERELHGLSSDGLKEYFSVGTQEGLLSADQSRMMDNTVTMHSMPVRMLMTPLKKVPCLSDESTVVDLKRQVAQCRSSYVILMNKQSVAGIVSIFSVINRQLDDDQPLLPYAKNVLMMEEDQSVKSAFYRLRRNPYHCAVVIDSRRHPVGLIRMENVARYIIG